VKTAFGLLIAAPLALGALPATAADIRVHTTYFTITGSTLEQLDAALARHGPLSGGGDAGHPGATSVTFDGHVTYVPTDTGCRLGDARFMLDAEVILPRWKKPRKPDPETVLIWETLERDVKRHEERHAEIAVTYVKRMEMAVRNLGTRRTCKQLEDAVAATTQRYLAEHESEQRAFDRQEAREMDFRLKRQLRDRLRAGSD